MLDEFEVDQLKGRLCDRFTAWELVEILGVDVTDIVEQFQDECLRVDWSEFL